MGIIWFAPSLMATEHAGMSDTTSEVAERLPKIFYYLQNVLHLAFIMIQVDGAFSAPRKKRLDRGAACTDIGRSSATRFL
jgi:hypothetical protein